jgi:hypothetical protein
MMKKALILLFFIFLSLVSVAQIGDDSTFVVENKKMTSEEFFKIINLVDTVKYNRIYVKKCIFVNGLEFIKCTFPNISLYVFDNKFEGFEGIHIDSCHFKSFISISNYNENSQVNLLNSQFNKSVSIGLESARCNLINNSVYGGINITNGKQIQVRDNTIIYNSRKENNGKCFYLRSINGLLPDCYIYNNKIVSTNNLITRIDFFGSFNSLDFTDSEFDVLNLHLEEVTSSLVIKNLFLITRCALIIS